MTNFLKKNQWVFEFIAVAILIAVGIVANVLDFIFMYIVGLILIIFGLCRLFPLLKTTKDNLLKIIFAAEIVLNIVAGAVLIAEGTKGNAANTDLMRYLVGAALYVRGAIFFYSTAVRKETAEYLQFFVHLGFITLGPMIVIGKFFTTQVLGWIVLVMAVLSAVFIAIGGIKHYKNYRYERLAKAETRKIMIKQEEKKNEIGIQDPASKKQDVIIPETEKKDEAGL
jgi:hypothetical protein